MKWLLIAITVLLCGCNGRETFETVSDEPVQMVMAQPREISVRLPDHAVAPVFESEAEQVYMSDTYEIILETRAAGDLDATVRSICGYEKEDLTVMETQWDDVTRYEFVWAAAGENGDRLGRAVVLDDGAHHYCMSVLRDAQAVSQIVWRDVFSSFTIV